MGYSGKAATKAAPGLIGALHDPDGEVRREAAWELGRIGPGARNAVGRLLDAVWLGDRGLRLVAAEAMGQIGPDAKSAVYSLLCLLKVCDDETRRAVIAVLEKIAPESLKSLPVVERRDVLDTPTPPPKAPKKKSWQRSLEAAKSLYEMENIVRELLIVMVQEGFFNEQRDTDSLCAALVARGHQVQSAHLFMPLLDLTTEGPLSKIQNGLGQWVYFTAGSHPRGSGESTSGGPPSCAL